MTNDQHVAEHDRNRVFLSNTSNLVIKVTRQAWIDSAVRVCMHCGYTGDFTHLYEGAYPECPMCEGE